MVSCIFITCHHTPQEHKRQSQQNAKMIHNSKIISTAPQTCHARSPMIQGILHKYMIEIYTLLYSN